jgi:hypothetical protein
MFIFNIIQLFQVSQALSSSAGIIDGCGLPQAAGGRHTAHPTGLFLQPVRSPDTWPATPSQRELRAAGAMSSAGPSNPPLGGRKLRLPSRLSTGYSSPDVQTLTWRKYCYEFPRIITKLSDGAPDVAHPSAKMP